MVCAPQHPSLMQAAAYRQDMQQWLQAWATFTQGVAETGLPRDPQSWNQLWERYTHLLTEQATIVERQMALLFPPPSTK